MLRCQEKLVTRKASEELWLCETAWSELCPTLSHPQTWRCGTPISHFCLNWKRLLETTFLLNYRSTPRSTSNTRSDLTLTGYSVPHNNSCPPPHKKRKGSFILCERKISGLTQFDEEEVHKFQFSRLTLFFLRMPCLCHRNRVQYPLSQHSICIQSFSLLFLQSSL